MNYPRVRKAVFPAAGLGTRFLPATKCLPKEMLALIDKPLIQYAVEEAVASDIRDIVVVTSRGKAAMEDHFDRAPELEEVLGARDRHDDLAAVQSLASLARFIYVRQQHALGLGHAVLTAAEAVGDEPFAVFLSDDVIRAEPPCMRQLLDVYNQTGASVVCIERVPAELTSSYGMVDVEPISERLYRVRDLIEKPRPGDAPSDLGIIGRYVLTPRIFAKIDASARGAGNEIQLTDAIRGLLADEPVYAYRFEGDRYDAGNKLGLLKATVDFALDRPDLGKAFRDFLRSRNP